MTSYLAYVTACDLAQSFIFITAVKFTANVFICKHILAIYLRAMSSFSAVWI